MNYCPKCRAKFIPLNYYEGMCAACELKDAAQFLVELKKRGSSDTNHARDLVKFWTARSKSLIPFSWNHFFEIIKS